jgi:hypothetical protein
VPAGLISLAVTLVAKEPMVTLLPTVTEEMLMGTVPLMDAVTEPICAVPAVSRVLVNKLPVASSTARNLATLL